MQRKAPLILMLLTSLMLGVTCTFGKADNPVNDPKINNANQVIDMLETFEAGVDAEAEARAAAAVRAAAAETHPYTRAILTFDFPKAITVDGTQSTRLHGGRCSQPQFPDASSKSYLIVAADGTLEGKCTSDTGGVSLHFEAVLSGAVDQKTDRINFHFAETEALFEVKGTGRWTRHTEMDFHGSEKDVVWVGDTVSGLAAFTTTCDSNPERPEFSCTNAAPSYKESGLVPFTLKFSAVSAEDRPHFTHAVLFLDAPNAIATAGPRPPLAYGCWPPQYPDPSLVEGYLRVNPDDSIKGVCTVDKVIYVASVKIEGDLNGHVSTAEGHVDFDLNVTVNKLLDNGERVRFRYTISFNGNNAEYEWNENALTGTATFRWDCARLEGTRSYCSKTAEGNQVTEEKGNGTVPFLLQFYP